MSSSCCKQLAGDTLPSVSFQINGKTYTARSGDVPLDTSLNTYIRDYAHLKGTKFMCKEGGCGACIVAVTSNHPVTKKNNTYAVNSCLLKIWSCQGYNITTIEKAKNYRYKNSAFTLSDQLANYNGSQCGYCSPGMVMNMYGLIKSTPNISEEDIETNFAGNICRCTGYKPILNAFRSLINNTDDSDSYIPDIEDGGCATVCPMRRRCCSSSEYRDEVEEEHLESCFIEFAMAPSSLRLTFKNNQSWFKADSVKEIFEIFDMLQSDDYMLICGNTTQGVSLELFRDAVVGNYIDISGIAELKNTNISPSGIVVGGNVTLTEFLKVLDEAKSNDLFNYAKELYDHTALIANLPVRNVGTIAGNLVLKKKMFSINKMFQSDIFLLLETVGAKITIMGSSSITEEYLPSEFLDMPLDSHLITKITLPPLSSSEYKIRTYKIMPRAQNAPAIVNAGFLFKLKNITQVESATIVYGGINYSFIHAAKTESYLSGKDISDEKVLKQALEQLQNDIPLDIMKNVEPKPIQPPEARQKLAFNLYYKTILYLNQNIVNSLYKTGGDKLTRSLSSGSTVNKIEEDGARGKPIPKIEAHIQCRGEAQYVYDIPVIHGQLYGALVIAPQGPGKLASIDTSSAMEMPGVVAFYKASDIPLYGENNMFDSTIVTPECEELFCSNNVLYAGQPVGVLVAQTQDQAINAARLITKGVKVDMPSGNPLMTIDDVLKKYKEIPNERVISLPFKALMQDNVEADGNEEKEITEDTVYVEGELQMGSQYHYSMELQTCVVVPIEDGQFEVYSSTQWPFSIQRAISRVLGISENKVDVIVRRLGGAYGCKVTKAAYTACACALAAYRLQRPVRMVLDMETNMKAIGKRYALKCRYGVTASSSTGKITRINSLTMFDDSGITLNDPIYTFIPDGIINCYNINLRGPSVKFEIYGVKTDAPSSTWCRAPGSLEGTFVIESIMNKIANKLSKDPQLVRMNNISEKNSLFRSFFAEKLHQADYMKEKYRIDSFNKKNYWTKQGYALVPMEYTLNASRQFSCTVSVCGGDGSISISHGAVEIGQGINTKVAVAAAYVFELPDVSNIQVKPTNIIYSPNNPLTGSSVSSDSVTYACLRASQAIKKRLDELKQRLNLPDDISWAKLVSTAYNNNVNLSGTYMLTLNDGSPLDPDLNKPSHYKVSGVCSAKVEVDILTGQHIVRQVQIWEDVGRSFAPTVDIGQIQGAFVMGLGYFTSEEIHYSQTTGELLTNRTWTYDPPGAMDIPERFDVTIQNKNDLGDVHSGFARAKATGEPPLCLSLSVFFAIKEAVKSARQDADVIGDFDFYPPATVSAKILQSHSDMSKYKITS